MADSATELALLAVAYDSHAVRLAKKGHEGQVVDSRSVKLAAACFTVAEGLRRRGGAIQKP